MKTLITAAALVLSGWTPEAMSQEDTAHHREFYAQVNKEQKSMKKSEASLDDDGLVFALEGWSEGGALRKIVARVPGEDGDGSEEYYLEDGKPLFVFRHYGGASPDGEKSLQVEDRFYFKEGRLFKWLGPDKQPVATDSGEFAEEAVRLTENAERYGAALGGGAGKSKAKKKGKDAVLEGTFVGLEEGDYFHWVMKTAKGEETSFFVLRPDETLDAVLETPEDFVGKRCRVTWRKSKETLPEAGGVTEVEHVLKVEWLEK